MQKERTIALTHVTDERIAALQTLQETITNERQLVVQQVEEISKGVVDHAMTRVIQIIVGVLIAVVVVLLVGLFLVRQMIAGLITQKAKAT